MLEESTAMLTLSHEGHVHSATGKATKRLKFYRLAWSLEQPPLQFPQLLKFANYSTEGSREQFKAISRWATRRESPKSATVAAVGSTGDQRWNSLSSICWCTRRWGISPAIGSRSHEEEDLRGSSQWSSWWTFRDGEDAKATQGVILLARPLERCEGLVSVMCQMCCKESTNPKNRAPLQIVPAGTPMQVVAVDILGPLPESTAGNRYILVASDYFTRWVEAYAIPNQEAVTVARKLTDEFFCRFSPPEQLHSDQGKQFESQVVAEVCKILGIKKTRTTPYHPQCDGLVERFNRTLLNMLTIEVAECPFNWEEVLACICFAYNTSVQATTGFTPFYLMFGRQARLPVDLMYGVPQKDEVVWPETYAGQLKKSLEKSYAAVRKTFNTEHKRQKTLYDRKVHGRPFSAGDLVWLFNPAVPRGKLKTLHGAPWIGPFRVKSRISDATYRIQDTTNRKRKQVIHFDRLKTYTLVVPLPQQEESQLNNDLSNLELVDDCVEDDDIQSENGIENEGQNENSELPHEGPHPAEVQPAPRYPRQMRREPERFEPVFRQ